MDTTNDKGAPSHGTRPQTPRSDYTDHQETWRDRLQMLTWRFPGAGIGADIVALSESDAWGVYRFLSRLAIDEAVANRQNTTKGA